MPILIVLSKIKWAVVIGVSKFLNVQFQNCAIRLRMRRIFKYFLVTKSRFAKDHILLLTDEQATESGIWMHFGDGWLPRRVMKDDLVVVFISSHGSPADVAGEKNFIIAYDSIPIIYTPQE